MNVIKSVLYALSTCMWVYFLQHGVPNWYCWLSIISAAVAAVCYLTAAALSEGGQS